MSDTPAVHIFHIFRNDGSSLFLHPFRGDEKGAELFENARISGLYGSEPEVSSLTSFRNELYGISETAIKSWNAESRFIPRFIIAAVVFVAVFLFMSVVVRDPIPLLDELLIGLAAAIGSYTFLVRRDLKSSRAEHRRISIRSAIDSTLFNESSMVHRVEEILHAQELDGNSLRLLDENRELLFAEHELPLAGEALEYLSLQFRESGVRRQERRLLRAQRTTVEDKALLKWAEAKKVDFPLFCLYVRLKRELQR